MPNSKQKPKGVLYIDTSKDGKGFQRLYERVRDEIFVPSLKNMPTKQELRSRIARGLAEGVGVQCPFKTTKYTCHAYGAEECATTPVESNDCSVARRQDAGCPWRTEKGWRGRKPRT